MIRIWCKCHNIIIIVIIKINIICTVYIICIYRTLTNRDYIYNFFLCLCLFFNRCSNRLGMFICFYPTYSFLCLFFIPSRTIINNNCTGIPNNLSRYMWFLNRLWWLFNILNLWNFHIIRWRFICLFHGCIYRFGIKRNRSFFCLRFCLFHRSDINTKSTAKTACTV